MKKSVALIAVIFVVVAVAIASTVWLIPYYERHETQQRPSGRLNKPYYPQLEFAIKLLDILQKEDPLESIIYSPHSIYQVLLITYFGTNGETEKELRNALGLNWVERRSDAVYFYNIMKNARTGRFKDQSIEFNSTEKIYITNEIDIAPSLKQMFSDRIEQLNFADEPEQCTKHINHFVEEVTKNNIKNIIPPGKITSMTEIVIANAVYFKGNWESVFDKKETKRALFYDHTGRDPFYIDMMFQSSIFDYGYIRQLKTKVLKMPYKGENGSVSMYIFLPASTPTAIDELLQKLTPEILDEAFNKLHGDTVWLSLPKLTFEKTSELIPAMKSMGIRNLFSQNADLSWFSSSRRLVVSDIIHKAKIEADEAGTTAAGSTIVEVKMSLPIEFNCDHPFMFVIHDEKFEEILFVGIYRG